MCDVLGVKQGIITESDVARIAGQQARRKFNELRQADYAVRLIAILQNPRITMQARAIRPFLQHFLLLWGGFRSQVSSYIEIL